MYIGLSNIAETAGVSVLFILFCLSCLIFTPPYQKLVFYFGKEIGDTDIVIYWHPESLQSKHETEPCHNL